jgi:hypothetical protein
MAQQLQNVTIPQIPLSIAYCANLLAYTENNVAFSIFSSALIQSEVMSVLAAQGYNVTNATFPSLAPTEWLAQLFNNGSASSEQLTPFVAIACPPYDYLLANISVQQQWLFVHLLVRSSTPFRSQFNQSPFCH